MAGILVADGGRGFTRGEAEILEYNTVNSEIFARNFRENKTLAKWQNHFVVY